MRLSKGLHGAPSLVTQCSSTVLCTQTGWHYFRPKETPNMTQGWSAMIDGCNCDEGEFWCQTLNGTKRTSSAIKVHTPCNHPWNPRRKNRIKHPREALLLSRLSHPESVALIVERWTSSHGCSGQGDKHRHASGHEASGKPWRHRSVHPRVCFSLASRTHKQRSEFLSAGINNRSTAIRSHYAIYCML